MLYKLRLASMSINKDTGNVNLQYACSCLTMFVFSSFIYTLC